MPMDKHMVANFIIDKAFIRILARDPKPIRLEDAKQLVNFVALKFIKKVRSRPTDSLTVFRYKHVGASESTILALTLWLRFLREADEEDFGDCLDWLNKAIVLYGLPWHQSTVGIPYGETVPIGPDNLKYAIHATLRES